MWTHTTVSLTSQPAEQHWPRAGKLKRSSTVHISMGTHIQARLNKPLFSLWTFLSSPPCQETTSGSPGSCSHFCFHLGRCPVCPQPAWGRTEALCSGASLPLSLCQHWDLWVPPPQSTRGRFLFAASPCCQLGSPALVLWFLVAPSGKQTNSEIRGKRLRLLMHQNGVTPNSSIL